MLCQTKWCFKISSGLAGKILTFACDGRVHSGVKSGLPILVP